jgi:hypothetical protein
MTTVSDRAVPDCIPPRALLSKHDPVIRAALGAQVKRQCSAVAVSEGSDSAIALDLVTTRSDRFVAGPRAGQRRSGSS